MTARADVVIADGVEVDVIPTPQEELRFTQNIRKNVAASIYNRRIKQQLNNPQENMWDDKTENSMLKDMLDGMDRQNIQVARIRVDEQAAKNGEEMTKMVGELLTQARRGRTGELPPIVEGAREMPQLPDSVLLPILSEEEASRTSKPDNYADFMSRTNQ